MRVVRVGPLPEGALEAAAEFHARVLPQVLGALAPPRNGEGDHPQGGGGVRSASPDIEGMPRPPVPLHHPVGGPPPPAGEALALIFPPAPYDHRGWRLAAVQDLARAAGPARVNAIAGDDEAAIAETLAYLERAPGVTGQLLAV
jgi:hypothetical protein